MHHVHLFITSAACIVRHAALLFNRVQFATCLAQVLFVNGVLQRPTHLVQVSVLLQLLLLRIQLGQTTFDELNCFLNLIAATFSLIHDFQRLLTLFFVNTRTADLLQQVQTFLVLHGRHFHYLPLLHDVVRIRAAETR